jgi:hypothetical protein
MSNPLAFVDSVIGVLNLRESNLFSDIRERPLVYRYRA